jgi:hypothetical protein
MNRRSLLVVVAIAVISVGLAIIGQNRSMPDANTGDLLLPGLLDSLNEVERLVVNRAGSETVATLIKDGAGWTVAEKGGYAADVTKIRQALVALAEARILEEKTSDANFYSRLGVEAIDVETASGTAISIDVGGAPSRALILGDAVNNSHRYVRRTDEARSFLIDRNPEIPRNTAQWLIPDIVDVRGARVQRVTITHPDGEQLSISKATPGEANFSVPALPEGRELLYPGVANLIGNGLRELKLDDVARDEATEAEEPVTVTEFYTFDGLVVTLTGRMGDGGKNWLTIAARFDSEQAAEFASVSGGELAAAGGDRQSIDPRNEAEAINATVAGWRYSIPAHQFEQLTRRTSELLRPPE